MTLTVERVWQLLHYNPTTGVFTWRDNVSGRAVARTRAGSLASNGYRYIGIDGKKYLEQRLVVLYFTGEWPENQVDHHNLDRADNRLANLRLATSSQNNCNATKRSHNTSGYKGVTRNKRDGNWQAQIRIRGRNNFLGYHATPEAAHAAYCAASAKLHGEFGRAA